MLQQVIEAVKQVAHDEVMPRYLKVARERKSDGSLFTQADIAAQHALAQRLRQIHPYPVLGEEMTEAEQLASWQEESDAIWCIDPIDGTTNFANGIPYFAVSVALLRAGRPVLGVTFDPTEDEVFYAEKGKGAFLNGVELPIHDEPRAMRECVAQVDLKRLPENLSSALGRRPPYSSQRNFGAATLEWCYVAAGRFHLYLHGGQRLWDYAAGAIILEEAGGHMCTLTREEFWSESSWTKSVIATLDPSLFTQWKSWIRDRL
jgi:myo-inositol-1(or 4)-monophosphatase